MNAIAAYRQSRVETASPLQLVVMLYQELLRRIELGARGLEAGSPMEASAHFTHGREILAELLAALQPQPGNEALIGNLSKLYKWSAAELIAARRDNDPGRARRVAGVLEPMLEGWTSLLRSGGAR